MDTVFSIVLLVIAFALSLVVFRRDLQMLQQNSYRNNRYVNWLKMSGDASSISRIFLLAILMMLIAFPFVWSDAVASGLLLAMIVNELRKKYKKPLVFTKRVWRIYISLIVATLATLAASALVDCHFVPRVAIVISFFSYAYVIVVNRMLLPVENAINRSYVDDAKRRLAQMPDMKVIGITGSYGKTSVKFFLTELLSGKYNVLCTPRNFNTDLGVTRTVREDLQPVHEVFVCEMGARYEKDIQTICDIVHPKYGVITAIGPQHLETFGSMDTIVKTKFELYDALPADGMAFLNYDNEYILHHKGDKPQIGFGESEQADVRLLSMELTAHGTDFAVSIEGKTVQFHTELIGYHNILDITAAIAVAHKMRVTNAELQRRVRRLHPVEHRLQLLPKRGRVSIIDDAYNSNPQGFHGAIDTLRRFEGKTRVLVTPGMIELGAKEYELNKQAGRYAATGCDYIILVGKKQTQPLLEGVREETAFDQSHVQQVDTLQDAWKIIPTLPGEELVVLLENDLPDNY